MFYRDLRAAYRSVVSADGMYLRTEDGQRILDAVGGAGTVVIGHGVREITDAVARHGSEISFSYGATFTNPWQEQLAEALVAMNPEIAARVYFVSGGSEGVETAVKMARQYHLQCGRPGRTRSSPAGRASTAARSPRCRCPAARPGASRSCRCSPRPRTSCRRTATAARSGRRTRAAAWPAPMTWSGRS